VKTAVAADEPPERPSVPFVVITTTSSENFVVTGVPESPLNSAPSISTTTVKWVMR